LTALAEKAIRERKKNQHSDITSIENQIDQLVYQLYGLTAEEIAIVEGK
jgi:adenine-specific DNA-methyltransferase